MIILYDYTETSFTSNGLGCLNDALKCEVTEELNGNYELEMDYPVNGIHYSDITLRRIILAKPNSYDREQPFRIYSISKPINGVVTINAEHISYDMSGFPVKGAVENYAWYVNDVFEHIRNNSVYTCPFTFSTDITEEKKEIDLSKPRSIRSYLGTDDGLLSLFGGEWEFDRYNATLHKERGANRGVSIEYGKNLIDLTQEEKCSEMYTAVYPFYYQEDDGLQYLGENVVPIFPSSYKKALTLDLTSEFEEMPTQDELRTKTNEYIEKNKLSEPTVSLTVSFIKNPEVIEALQDVRLGDTVGVKFVKIGVDTTSRCITYSFNAITEQYNSIELGEPTETIVDTVSQTSKQASDTSQALDDEVDRATESEQLILEEVDTVEKTLRSEITSGDGALQSQITQTAGEISAEVSRATSAESAITGQLSLKIDKDDDGTIVSLINGSANKINFTASNMFTVDAPNIKIDATGNVTVGGKIVSNTQLYLSYNFTALSKSSEVNVLAVGAGEYTTDYISDYNWMRATTLSTGLTYPVLKIGSGACIIQAEKEFQATTLYANRGFFDDIVIKFETDSTYGSGRIYSCYGATGRNYGIASTGWVRSWVNGQGFSTTSGITVNSSGTTTGKAGSYTSNLYLNVSSAGTYEIVQGRNVLLSDRRKKECITDARDISDAYMRLKPVHFKFREDTDGTDEHWHYGFIAQDVKEAFDMAGIDTYGEALVGCDTEKDEWLLDKEELHAMHTQMIQKQQKEIEQLTIEMSILKQQVEVLQNVILSKNNQS